MTPAVYMEKAERALRSDRLLLEAEDAEGGLQPAAFALVAGEVAMFPIARRE